MKRAVLNFLILTCLSEVAFGVFGRHKYVHHSKTWSEARKYCRNLYTDLSSIHSQEEDEELKNIVIKDKFIGAWIGLYKDASDTWKWSGGGNASNLKWAPWKSKSVAKGEICVARDERGWSKLACDSTKRFYCFESQLVLGKEKKTWEEALDHCREQHTDLASLPSESALVQALQTSRKAKTERMWTGLRYLAVNWLWVNGDAVKYQAWRHKEMSQCPAWSLHCGALSLEGHWESWDCEDKLNFICY